MLSRNGVLKLIVALLVLGYTVNLNQRISGLDSQLTEATGRIEDACAAIADLSARLEVAERTLRLSTSSDSC
jgi:hypothetical protein